MKAIFSTIKSSELLLHGKPVSPGIAIGKVLALKNVDIIAIQRSRHIVESIDTELARLEQACQTSREQVRKTLENARQHGHTKSVPIFSSYLELLNDQSLIGEVQSAVREQRFSSECIIAARILEIRTKLSDGTDDFSRKLLDTMLDIYLRIIYNLVPASVERLRKIQAAASPAIVVADKLTPVEVAGLPADKILALVIEEVSNTSHASVLSRSLAVPVVVRLPGIGSLLDESCEMIVDGFRGMVVINPRPQTVEDYRKFEKRVRARRKNYPANLGLYCSTSDGVEIRLASNCGTLAEADEACRVGISEIGLLRSEVFYLSRSALPTVAEETAFYNSILAGTMQRVTVRLLDLGADKIPPYMPMPKEANPELGLRGIRFLLQNREYLKHQLRSIFRCAKLPAVRILLPFVTVMEDVEQACAVIAEVLSETGHSREAIEIGIMVEIPSVALSIEDFLRRVDFVNIGTNDLLQYLFAADREQVNVAHYSRFSHPVALRLLRSVIGATDKSGKELVACGAMASHPHGICLLIALGVRNFSLHPEMAGQIREIVSRVSTNDLEQLIVDLDASVRSKEIEERLRRLLG